jgi:hypothetical protein
MRTLKDFSANIWTSIIVYQTIAFAEVSTREANERRNVT